MADLFFDACDARRGGRSGESGRALFGCLLRLFFGLLFDVSLGFRFGLLSGLLLGLELGRVLGVFALFGLFGGFCGGRVLKGC